MKQNELNIITQDLFGSAKSISDMISKPEILNRRYNKESNYGYSVSKAENATEAFIED